MRIFFSKPAHKTGDKYWVNLNIDIIRKARKQKEMIEVVLTAGICKAVDPKWLLKNGVKTEAVYLRPDEPMKLVGNYYELLTEEEKLRKFSEQCL